MLFSGVLSRVRSAAHITLLCGFATLMPFQTFASGLTLAWDASPDTNVTGYNIYYGVASREYTNKISAGSALTLNVDGLAPGTTYYFAATAHTENDLESDYSAEISAFIAAPVGNSPPVALGANLTTSEDQAVNIILGATDADMDQLSFQVVSPPTHGTLAGSAPNLVYQPFANYSGQDSLSFQARDGSTDSLPANIAISIAPVNDPPAISGLANIQYGIWTGHRSHNFYGV